MTKLYLLLIFCGANLISNSSHSQINSFPYFQDFESNFIQGTRVEFLPYWTGNEISTSSRIYKDKSNMRGGTGAMAITPTSGFSAEITVSLSLSGLEFPKLEFWARSLANGTGTYPAVLEISTSYNGGQSFSGTQEIGKGAFINATTNYARYEYTFPENDQNGSEVILKIVVKRGTPGSGSAAKVVMDDFRIFKGESSYPQISYRTIQINEIFADPTGSLFPDSVGLPNSEFIELFNSGNDTINLKNFVLNGNKINEYIFPPKSYVIACPASASDKYKLFGSVIGLSSWSNLLNTGDKIFIKDPLGNVIDSLSYDLLWYNDKRKQDGGWSLEQINPLSKCLGSFNWSSSVSNLGATPGKRNSIHNSLSDTIKLKVEEIKIRDRFSVEIVFNKPLSAYREFVADIKPKLGFGEITHHTNSNSLFITFQDSIAKGVLYRLILNDVKDCSQQNYKSVETSFAIGDEPLYNDLIISEIMADPSPSYGLPESEYLELHNRSAKVLSLKNLKLYDEIAFASFPDFLIYPSEYLIICPASSKNSFADKGRVISPDKWLSLTNAGKGLILYSSNANVFSLSYTDDWYQDEDKKDGGYSLELIDINHPCLEESNWTASVNKSGGTPGLVNSVANSKVDLTAPEISGIDILSDTVIILNFNEKVDGRIASSQCSISPEVKINSIDLLEPFRRSIKVRFTLPLNLKVLYDFSIENIRDCAGNGGGTSMKFALPESPDSLDIIINEILFNPRPGGVDFVELYNRSDKYISLRNWKIGNVEDGVISNLKPIIAKVPVLAPGAFIAFTADPLKLKDEYPLSVSNNIYLNEIPSLPDDEGGLLIQDDKNNTVDLFNYSQSYHFSLLQDKDGISLERISKDGMTNNSANWHSAATQAGRATPGYKNSSAKDSQNSEEQFKIDPQVFSPDGDGYNDFTLINYSFGSPGKIASVFIYDREGRRVRTIAQNLSLASNGFFQWDGADDNGNKIYTGMYFVFVELFDLGGRKSRWKKEIIVASKF